MTHIAPQEAAGLGIHITFQCLSSQTTPRELHDEVGLAGFVSQVWALCDLWV